MPTVVHGQVQSTCGTTVIKKALAPQRAYSPVGERMCLLKYIIIGDRKQMLLKIANNHSFSCIL